MNASIDADYLAPDRYDRYYGAFAEVPGWLVNELSSKGQVLELACGTGRFAIPLAEHGLAVTGLDYSEPMLRLARSKAETRQTEVDWILADMRRFDTGKQYGAILLLFNALLHLHERSDFEDCTRCVRRHLSTEGVFVLDVFVPGLEFLTRDPAKRYPAFQYTEEGTGRVVQVTQSYRYEVDTQIARTVHYEGDPEEVVGGLNLRMYFPKELDALLSYNGLRIVEKFGSWDRAAFGPDSRHQLYLCTTGQKG